jgi:hypothetical protein
MRRITDQQIRHLSQDRLLIADGSQFQTWVYDLRRFGPWATPSKQPIERPNPRIIYHHTASRATDLRHRTQEIALLERIANTAPWGLPYNFVVCGAPPHRIYYLNDVDSAWPHTLGANGAVAIAALGHFSVEQPSPRLIRTMWRLADALATMWGHWCPEVRHCDLVATECPGQYLAPLLKR